MDCTRNRSLLAPCRPCLGPLLACVCVYVLFVCLQNVSLNHPSNRGRRTPINFAARSQDLSPQNDRRLLCILFIFSWECCACGLHLSAHTRCVSVFRGGYQGMFAVTAYKHPPNLLPGYVLSPVQSFIGDLRIG